MITSGTFNQELPNSKNTRIDFRNLTVEAGSAVKEIRINGQQSGQFLALQLSGNPSVNYITVQSHQEANSGEAQKMVDSLNSGESIDVGISIQNGKYEIDINSGIIFAGTFNGGVSGLSVSGSGLKFDKEINIDTPNIAVEISGSGGLESRDSLFTIVPDVNLDIKLSGIEIEITDDNGANEKINIDSGVMISGTGSSIQIKKNSASGISGLLEDIWVSSFGSRTKITRE